MGAQSLQAATLSAADTWTADLSVTGLIRVSVVQTGYHQLQVQITDSDGDWIALKNLANGLHDIDIPASTKGRIKTRIGIPAGGYVSGSSAIEVF